MVSTLPGSIKSSPLHNSEGLDILFIFIIHIDIEDICPSGNFPIVKHIHTYIHLYSANFREPVH